MTIEVERLQGQTLSGRFRLGRRLGSGGYGAVFEGVQLSVGRTCAVKVLSPKVGLDDASEERFAQEARATATLCHPNSVVLYDFGRDESLDVFWMAMELLRGETLKERLERAGAYSLGDCLGVVRGVAASLADAHRRGLVHRDVKPGNVMLVEGGEGLSQVKLIDFGIVKALRETLRPSVSMTRTGRVLGTPKYMAPEQICDETVDARADVYALAIMIYEMLTGEVPFSGGSAMKIARRQVIERPRRLREVDPSVAVGAAFEQVLLRALSKDPSHRYAGMEEFVEALEEAALAVGEVGGSERSSPEPRGAARRQDEAHTTALGSSSERVKDPDYRLASEASAPLGEHTEATAVLARKGLEEVRPSCREPVVWRRWAVMAAGAMGVFGVGLTLANASTEAPTRRVEVAPPAASPAHLPAMERNREAAQRAEVSPMRSKAQDVARSVQVRAGQLGARRSSASARGRVVAPPKDSAQRAPSVGSEGDGRGGGRARGKAFWVPLRVIPWGEVHVDGVRLGDGGSRGVRVGAGVRAFELVQAGEVRARRIVDVSEGHPKIVELIAE